MRLSFRILLFSIAVGLFIVGLNACFTEVGNPEDEVSMTAAFRVDDTPDSVKSVGAPDSVQVMYFPFILDSASYLDTDSTSGYLWRSEANRSFDFAGNGATDSLPPQALKNGVLEEMYLPLHFSAGGSLGLDTLDFQTFSDPGYMKGSYSSGDSSVRFLFAFPDNEKITLEYPQATLKNWREGALYHCQFSFFALQWLSKIDLRQVVLEKDKTGRSIAIFNPEYNQVLNDSLNAGFDKSFNTPQTY